MKRWGVLVVSVVLFVSGAQGAELASKSRIRENIAVIDFEGKGVSPLEASIFADFLRNGLVNTGTFNVVEKANMEKLLSEMAFQQTGLTSTEDAVKIGKILNVRKMVLGSVSRLKDTCYI
ncbi:MAG: CsgG/HfaB family protein, partial [Endomicrobiales bacterium]